MTPKEEKEQLKLDSTQRQVVKALSNRILSQFSFGNCKLWRDVYRFVGYNEAYINRTFFKFEQEKPVIIKELRSYLDDMRLSLEVAIWLRKNPPVYEKEIAVLESGRSVDSSSDKIQPGISEPVKETTQDESGYNNENNYGLSESPKEKAFLYYFQKKAAAEILHKVTKENRSAVLLIASTGTGKTFITAAVDRRLKDQEFTKDKSWGHTEYLSVTRSTVVEQTQRVLKNFFGISHPYDTEVINIEQLRARAGELWIDNKTIIQEGEETEVYRWKPMINPVVIYLDESQGVKNESSIQHKIICAFSDVMTPTTIIHISATPFTRVSEAKAFAIATKKDISHLGFPTGTKLSVHTWATYAKTICGEQSAPDEYNEAAVERLMKDLDDYIVRVKGVRWQFNAINKVEIIDFDTPASEMEYHEAWKKYLVRKAKLEESVTDNPRFQALIELGIFLAAAEHCKRHIFARRMYSDVQNGKAAVLAVKFKKTIIAVVKILHEEYGVSRDQIALIWGGGQTQLTAKQKLKAQVRKHENKFKEAGVSMEDLMLDDVDDRVLEDLPEHLRLGNQSKEQRQKEIDRFQSGKALYAIYSFKAGGTGLSLHHTDEQTKEKCKRQKNGYAVVEDIVNIPTRPRKVTVSPTWSPIEMVQGVGRCPRLTSLSNTEQTLLFYRGTVEEDQAYVVTHRLKCLSKVVRQHESWQDLIVNHAKAKEIARKLVEEMPEVTDNSGEEQQIIEEESEE